MLTVFVGIITHSLRRLQGWRCLTSAAKLSNFTPGLFDKEKRSIHNECSSAVYRFGNGEQKKALRCVMFPYRFGGKRVYIKTDVISCGIPLLVRCHSMKAAGMRNNLVEDTAVFFSIL